MMNKITNFFKNIKIPDGDDITAFWVIYIMMPVFAIILISVPFWTIYVVLMVVTPSEKLPIASVNLTELTIVDHKEIDKRNEDNRLHRVTVRRNINKQESDKYITKLKELNNDRFDFSDIQKFLFLRNDINEVNSIETSIQINCDDGLFSIGHRVYQFNGESSPLQTHLNKWIFEAKKYPEIDKIATKVCSESRKHSVY